jgi:hypothetical protein
MERKEVQLLENDCNHLMKSGPTEGRMGLLNPTEGIGGESINGGKEGTGIRRSGDRSIFAPKKVW